MDIDLKSRPIAFLLFFFPSSSSFSSSSLFFRVKQSRHMAH